MVGGRCFIRIAGTQYVSESTVGAHDKLEPPFGCSFVNPPQCRRDSKRLEYDVHWEHIPLKQDHAPLRLQSASQCVLLDARLKKKQPVI